jgi:hypothetical protein
MMTLFALMASALAVIIGRLTLRTSILGSAIAGMAIGASCILGVVSFNYPPQALILLESNADPVSLLLGLNLWGPRYALSYPAVIVRDALSVSLDEGYTLYACMLLWVWALLLARLVAKAITIRFHAGPILRTAIVIIVVVQLVLIASAMNGRLVPAFLGMTLILDSQLASAFDRRHRYVRLGIGVFLSMMSSGTMMVGLVQTIVGTGIVAIRGSLRPGRALALISVGALGIGALFVPLVLSGVRKNLAYYDGSVLKMLSHGAGQIFFIPDWVIILELLLILSCASAAYALGAYRALRELPALEPIALSLPISVALGLFGYSTLLMLLPGVITLVTLALAFSAHELGVLVPAPGQKSLS